MIFFIHGALYNPLPSQNYVKKRYIHTKYGEVNILESVNNVNMMPRNSYVTEILDGGHSVDAQKLHVPAKLADFNVKQSLLKFLQQMIEESRRFEN